jgi:beta-glucanase (GH16 family)
MIRTEARTSRRVLAALCALALAGALAGCDRNPTETTWDLVWQDEFDGTAGQSPDPARWGFDVGTDWGNAQLEYDTARPENVSLDGAGRLSITARREDYQGQSYTSGRINTRGRFQQATGRFEARMRMPRGQGLWPAFWLLGADFATVGWPACGEIDIMEYRGQEPTVVHGSLHGPGYSGGSAITRHHVVPAGLDTDFHVYAVEWTSSGIVWSVDGAEFFRVTPRDVPSGAPWAFTRPFFVVLDLAVGGHFVGPPDSTTTFPQDLLVDYVRVYRRGS